MFNLCCLSVTADEARLAFVSALNLRSGMTHTVARKNLFDGVNLLYKSKGMTILEEYPFRIKFDGELGVDLGGVSREVVCRGISFPDTSKKCMKSFSMALLLFIQ